MKTLTNKVVAITGAASGIGQMLAVNLSARGCEVAISDIDANGLQQTAAMVEKQNGKVSIHEVDVARQDSVEHYAADVVTQHGRVDMIINNAGVSLAQSVEDVTYSDFNWLMGINFWGVVYGVKAFLPYLQQQPESHIVNISSINGFITWPNHAPYCASKFAVKGFTESLWQELRHTNIRVSCVHPGGIKTNIARNTRFYRSPGSKMTHDQCVEAFDKIAGTSSDKAAQQIIAGILKNKQRILVGPDAYLLDVLTRLFPVKFVKWMAIVAGRK
ncbi:MAG: acetoin dehydrogenase [Desulfobacterium sp.]|nr:acetoin dehydrogenase [Desulfobacterium sp.]